MNRLLYMVLIPVLSLAYPVLAQEKDGEKKDQRIYSLEVYVLNKETSNPVGGVEVELVGTDGSQLTATTNASGFCEFVEKDGRRCIQPETSYVFKTNCDSYLVGKGQVSTVNREKSARFVHEIYVQPSFGGCYVLTVPEVHFEKNSAVVSETEIDTLKILQKMIRENPTIVVEIAGHASKKERKPMELSKKRAEAVVAELVKLGIREDRLVVKAWGNEKPRHKWPDTNKETPLNRCVHSAILSFEYKPPEGVEIIEWNPDFALEVYIFDKDTKAPLPGGKVKVEGSDNSVAMGTTNKEGVVIFDRTCDGQFINDSTDYTITIEYNGVEAFNKITTRGTQKSTRFVKEFYIQRKRSCVLIITFPEVAFEGGNTTIEGSMVDSLDYMYNILKENPTIIVEVKAACYSKEYMKVIDTRVGRVIAYLVNKGIDRSRLVHKIDLVEAPDPKIMTEKQKHPERRVEFRVLSFDHVPKE